MRTGLDARTQLLDVAERLFAERGIDAVSLSEILETAGQRNKSAIYYHFGSKEGLIAAIAERRSHLLNERRSQLLEELATAGNGDNVRSLAGALVAPLAELLDDQDNHYLGFLARYHLDRTRRQLVESVDPQVTKSYRAAGRLLRSASGLPGADFDIRFGLVLDMIFTSLAGRQAEERAGDRRIPRRPVFLQNLTECVAGSFTANADA
jgi:AcrR family transcriptional regulator